MSVRAETIKNHLVHTDRDPSVSNEGKRQLGIKENRHGRTDNEQTKITALANGPYLVKGLVVVVDAEGNEFPSKRETVALCRCGGSTTKPFCDGTHSKIGFRASQRAVRDEEGQS